MDTETHKLINTAYKVIKGFIHNPDEALDLTQQTMLKVFEKKSTFTGKSDLNTWTYRIAANIAIDSFRTPEIKPYKVDWYEQDNEDEDIKMDIRKALTELEEDKREIMLLYFFAGLNINEISEKLDIPLGTANSRFERAKKALQSILSEMGYVYE